MYNKINIEKEIPFVNTYFTRMVEYSTDDQNDCVVRALRHVFDIEYETALELSKKYLDKQDNVGVEVRLMITQFESEMGEELFNLTGKRISWVKESIQNILNSSGIYIINFVNHTFAIIDGVIYGNPDDVDRILSGEEIYETWKII